MVEAAHAAKSSAAAEAVTAAAAGTQSCQVEVCVGNADLDVLGRIGALLRY